MTPRYRAASDTTTPARYADRRTAATRRPTASPRAPGRPTAPTLPLRPPHLGPANIAARTREEHVTDTADQVNPTTDPAVPIRLINDTPHTTRAGIVHMAGWKPGNSVNVRSRTDPDFPHGTKIGREYWYPIEGDHGVDAYLAILAQRAQDKRPPEVKPGNPDDILHGEDAADALHIVEPTLRSYVRFSKPFWDGTRDGTPLLPPPDIEEERRNTFGPYTHRAWYRRTLAAHHPNRLGPGTGAGRPAHDQARPNTG